MINQHTFDDPEFADDESDQAQEDQSIENVIQAMTPTPDQDAALGMEVEKRFEVALCYRTLLQNNFFNEDSDAAVLVEDEIREFIRTRLSTLMGLSPVAVQAPKEDLFTPEETTVLKAVAAKLMRPATKELEAPTVNRAKPPATPVPGPGRAPLTAMSKPTTPQPAPANNRRRPGRPAGSPNKPKALPLEGEDMVEGEIIEENGAKFKATRNQLGTLYKKSLAESVPVATRAAFPSGAQLQAIMVRQAEAQINSLGAEGIAAAAGSIAGIAVPQGE